MPSYTSKLSELDYMFWDQSPYYTGKCILPDYQASLYYSQGDTRRRIDFSKAGADDLEALYQACKPAEFGRNAETILDETYRKARKMDLDAFATLFDPRSLGILEQVSKALLTGIRRQSIAEMELYKLNVYGKGDFFKPHKDTPRNRTMLGSLVVVLPTQHEGGQLVLRHYRQEWTIDFTDMFAAAGKPSVCFVAFFGDVEHEVLPVTSGYRVTLTYNLHHRPSQPSASRISTPFHDRLKKALAEIVNDTSVLPKGGYLGFGLAHEYPYSNLEYTINWLHCHLKGSDLALAEVCDELGLKYCLKLLYRGMCYDDIYLITNGKLTARDWESSKDGQREFLAEALAGLTIQDVEGIEFVGSPLDAEDVFSETSGIWFLDQFYDDPITQILEVRHMSSVRIATPYAHYGNEVYLSHVYGNGCMLISVDPVESRQTLVV